MISSSLDLADRMARDGLAVAEDGDAVGDLPHLGQPVRDEDHQHSRSATASRDSSSSHSVSRGGSADVASSRISTDGVARERLGDLDDLPLGQRQPPHFEVRARRREAVALEELRRLLPQRRLADGAEAVKAARAGTRCSARRSGRERATAPGTPPRCRRACA